MSMHLVKDENGNVCAHAHSHTHSHTHEGGLEHSHPHNHEHGHENEHDHTHSHADGCSQESCGECRGCGHEHSEASDKNAALLTYMYQHNQSHAAELDQMAEKGFLEGNGIKNETAGN